MSTKPRIYIADLGAYNAGNLHGCWVDANQEPDEMLTDWETECGPVPDEYAIHDYEGFGKIKISEYADLATVSRLASLSAAYDEAFTVWYAEEEHPVNDELENLFLEEYVGTYDSEKDFAMSLADDNGAIVTAIGSVELHGRDAEIINAYLDWDAIARDLLIDGFYAVKSSDYRIFVFRRI